HAIENHLFEITGTKKYDTASGGSKTIFLMEPSVITGAPSAEEYRLARLEQGELEREAMREVAAKLKADEADAKAQAKAQKKAPPAAKPAPKPQTPEEIAGRQLVLAKAMLDDPKKKDQGIERLEKIIKDYPKSEAAGDAAYLLKKLRGK